jgi:hypothetical protein
MTWRAAQFAARPCGSTPGPAVLSTLGDSRGVQLVVSASASLIELKAEPAHDLTPTFDLVRIESGEFVASCRARFESERLDPIRKPRGTSRSAPAPD